MPQDESIQVVPSEEGGNGLPPETPAPSVPTEPAVPPVEEPAKPAEPPVAELFELPDGRKVDAETLSKEWKQNFYPDYTRKAQALAAKENLPIPAQKPTVDPEWQPQSYDELLKVAEDRILQSIESREQARIQEQQAIENAVVQQLEELKKIDTSLNENALFQHAMKYGFRDLAQAHQNMRDMSELAKKVQVTTANNIAKRNDAVSVTPGASGARPDPSHFSSAVDYMRSLK